MKFSVLVAIVPEEVEQEAIDCARDLGAGGMTVFSARGISNSVKKTFLGLTYDGSQTVLMMVLEKGLSVEILKALQSVVRGDDGDSKGLIFTMSLEHLAGIDVSQVEKFEEHVKQSI
ncbi:hypothetical protein SAMN06297229_1361 [Pseudidiomarina planktonica]|uniref:Nitrogen regulatory protein P-II family n=1 Tax=Pseudidiomarina planktonica TaxID=1323738 RepID=A0A1Y6ESU9_9GAMM|nr:transcriptional regulator [Pseudidiomarina planktonica]RUO65253.1 transcriptional regulator [Pseudidiomarina planktonica]SMQ65808.1 hypothetical protein SAMN06297229_1361 [Pseudidiomarina planktonica]